jgi:glycosidase
MGVLSKSGHKKPADEFWKNAIQRIKEKYPDFIFMAEAYWDLEWQLQQLGFDYTYDKTLTDRLSEGDVQGIRAHLQADTEFQLKSVRFIENHDEERAISKFGRYKSLAAAVVISTIQGVRFYYNGQFEGRKIRLPVQLGREPVEKPSQQVLKFYENLLQITKSGIFKTGTWQMINPLQADTDNNTRENILAWQWSLENELRIVVVNYSHSTSQCRLKIDLSAGKKAVHLEDLLTKIIYNRSVNEMRDPGLFIELKGYQSHIFSVIL